MPNIINNTDLDKIQKTVESGQKDKQFLRKPVKYKVNGILIFKKDINLKLNYHMNKESK